jgi:16S rRNA (cytosine967-C5)-methyltransferase
VLFAVCSILREEAEDVVARVLAEGTPLEPVVFDSEPLRAFCGERTSFRLLPDEHGTDGYYVASFARKG